MTVVSGSRTRVVCSRRCEWSFCRWSRPWPRSLAAGGGARSVHEDQSLVELCDDGARLAIGPKRPFCGVLVPSQVELDEAAVVCRAALDGRGSGARHLFRGGARAGPRARRARRNRGHARARRPAGRRKGRRCALRDRRVVRRRLVLSRAPESGREDEDREKGREAGFEHAVEASWPSRRMSIHFGLRRARGHRLLTTASWTVGPPKEHERPRRCAFHGADSLSSGRARASLRRWVAFPCGRREATGAVLLRRPEERANGWSPWDCSAARAR